MEREYFERQLKRIKDESKRADLKREFERKHLKKYDEALDKILVGPVWLKDDRIAELVAEAIKYRDGKVYELIAFTIMPNHIHLVFWLGEQHVTRIAKQSLKVNDISRTRNTVSRYIIKASP